MKWIGQHIYDRISRFRDSVYLEDISTGTIASGGNLGLDSNNKIVKATVSASVTDLHDAGVDGSANQLLTDDGDGSVTSESNLTFDGSVLTVTGDLTVNGDAVTFQSANADDPNVIIKNTTNDNQAARLQFWKNRTDAQADNDRVAEIEFFGEDASGNTQGYGKIMCQALESDHGVETGKLRLQVAEYDGTLTDGLQLHGQDANGEIDVTLGAGAASTTTGTDSVRVVTPDGLKDGYQGSSNIDTVGIIGSGSWRGDAIDGGYIATDTINSQHYVDGSIDTAHIADDQVTFAKASGVSPKVYGSIIKLLPTDFEANEDGGAGKTVQFDDTAPTGLKPGSTATELLAFVSIPEGMKATHVDVYAAQDLTMQCFELDINASGLTSKGSGTTNTTLDITDVNSTATNYLMIMDTTVATTNRIWGGKVTIAAQ